jgi:hypothetical protein
MPETFDIKAIEKRMDGAIASLKTEFSGLRTGRASIHLLDTIYVMAYGASTPINQVASVSAVRRAHAERQRLGQELWALPTAPFAKPRWVSIPSPMARRSVSLSRR